MPCQEPAEALIPPGHPLGLSCPISGIRAERLGGFGITLKTLGGIRVAARLVWGLGVPAPCPDSASSAVSHPCPLLAAADRLARHGRSSSVAPVWHWCNWEGSTGCTRGREALPGGLLPWGLMGEGQEL